MVPQRSMTRRFSVFEGTGTMQMGFFHGMSAKVGMAMKGRGSAPVPSRSEPFQAGKESSPGFAGDCGVERENRAVRNVARSARRCGVDFFRGGASMEVGMVSEILGWRDSNFIDGSKIFAQGFR